MIWKTARSSAADQSQHDEPAARSRRRATLRGLAQAPEQPRGQPDARAQAQEAAQEAAQAAAQAAQASSSGASHATDDSVSGDRVAPELREEVLQAWARRRNERDTGPVKPRLHGDASQKRRPVTIIDAVAIARPQNAATPRQASYSAPPDHATASAAASAEPSATGPNSRPLHSRSRAQRMAQRLRNWPDMRGMSLPRFDLPRLADVTAPLPRLCLRLPQISMPWPAIGWTATGFALGVAFWHAVGFWDFVSRAVLDPDKAQQTAQRAPLSDPARQTTKAPISTARQSIRLETGSLPKPVRGPSSGSGTAPTMLKLRPALAHKPATARAAPAPPQRVALPQAGAREAQPAALSPPSAKAPQWSATVIQTTGNSQFRDR